MILSINFTGKSGLIFFACLFCFAGCAHTQVTETTTDVSPGKFVIAVLPLENLSGKLVPLKGIRQSLAEGLKAQGLLVLDDKTLEGFMARHRVRYTGGIGSATAKAFKDEVMADAVLITSVEFYSVISPPKISIISRLVSTGDGPTILWMDSVGLAGDESPGILGIGLIEDMKRLQEKAIRALTVSLAESLSDSSRVYDRTARKRFQSKAYYKSPFINPGKKYRVAVVPFFNESERKNAGEMLVLHFVRDLSRAENFHVIEPGLIRQKMLDVRIIMHEGVSLADADLIYGELNVDLILTGKVLDYQDYEGSWGKPKVDFSAQVIERGSRKVVWSSKSYNTGDDGVFFFDRGRVYTANALASEMTQKVVERIVEHRE